MADNSFGIKELNLIGSGTPKIESPNNLNLDAVNVAISTNVTVGGDLDVDGHTELDAVNVSGVATATSFVKSGGTSSQYLMADGSTSTGGGGGGGIQNIVEDTTPQLGGNLDLFNKTINGTGNINITGVATATRFETGNIEIYDSGFATYAWTSTSGDKLLITGAQGGAGIQYYGNSYLASTFSGQLILTAGNVSTGDIVLKTGGSTRVTIDYDGSVDFTHQVTAASFVKTGGTSSQYLMADGSTSSSVTNSATFNITTTSPSSSYYTLNGSDRNGSVSGNNAGVTVYVGDTINFNLSSVSGSHPFYLKTLQGTGTSNQVSTPTATGQGSTGTATVSWTPNAAGAYYYQCSNHNAMHGIISVQTAPAGGSSLESRSDTNETTSSIAQGGYDDITIATSGKGFALLKIAISAPAWVVLYTDTTSRTSDAAGETNGRSEGTDPTPGSGVLAEVSTTTSGASTFKMTPGLIGWNDDGTPAAQVYARVYNKRSTTGSNTITVTLTSIKLEA